MKFIASNSSFIGFQVFLETVYNQFHLDETSLLSFFIIFLSCHKKSYVTTTHLIKMKLSFGVALFFIVSYEQMQDISCLGNNINLISS
jgi:hypothetical protein